MIIKYFLETTESFMITFLQVSLLTLLRFLSKFTKNSELHAQVFIKWCIILVMVPFLLTPNCVRFAEETCSFSIFFSVLHRGCQG